MGKKNQGNGIFSMQRDKLRSFMTDALALQAEAKATSTELTEHYKRCAENGIHTGAFKAVQKLLKSERGDALAFLEAFDNYRDVLLKDMERDLVKEAQKKTAEPAPTVVQNGVMVSSPAMGDTRETITAAEVAEVVAEALTDVITAGTTAEITPEPKKKRGRPSKAEMAAKAAAGQIEPAAIDPEGVEVPQTEASADISSEPEGYSPDDLNMRAGAQACKAGKSHLDNPHEPGSDRHVRWALGYQWQEDQATDAVPVPESQAGREASGMF